ncbi:MAG: DUF423 domain-containing protein [Flavobacteriaceae bacterium]|nr:DUF423 domain-containing protein [Flavobacteriaceae bacterium]
MKKNLVIASVLGSLAVILGAFGAHALKEKLSPDSLLSYETGVRYLMYHVIVVLFINTYIGFSEKTKNTLSSIFIAGMLLFSGSIFLITTGLVPAKIIWFITPVGGLLLIVSWLWMANEFRKSKNNAI